MSSEGLNTLHAAGIVVDNDDLVADWQVGLADKVHHIQFLHGTISGKRVILLNGEEISRKNWMFSLVGKEEFTIAGKNAEIFISCKGWDFEYTLVVEGKSLRRFMESRMRNTRTWLPVLDGEQHRVVLEVDRMEVWVDGAATETIGEFAECGTETHFTVAGEPVFIRAVSSGHKRKGILHSLVVDGKEIDPCNEAELLNIKSKQTPK